jgi:hypothetical protein
VSRPLRLVELTLDFWVELQGLLARPFGLVALTKQRRHLLVVPRHRHEGLVWQHARLEILPPQVAHDGIATLDVVIQKAQRFAGTCAAMRSRYTIKSEEVVMPDAKKPDPAGSSVISLS